MICGKTEGFLRTWAGKRFGSMVRQLGGERGPAVKGAELTACLGRAVTEAARYGRAGPGSLVQNQTRSR